MLIGIVLCLVGGALIETPIIGYLSGENGVGAIIAGIIFGALFLVPGVLLIVSAVSARIKERRRDPYMDELLEALKPGFREAVGKGWPDSLLVSFRKHYSEFMSREHVSENEAVQQDVTQIFRNIMQLQKNRLSRLGLTCEMVIRRMQYTKESGLTTGSYSDGKYNITDIKEEVAAKTIYKKDGQVIHTKQDKDTANYTVIQAKQIGGDRIICPSCGAETTREALLDGCDYCGTKFTVEDLGSRIAVFAFRSDFKLRYEKYLRRRNKVLAGMLMAVIIAVFLGFTVYAVTQFPHLLAEADGGIILTLLADLFAIVIASPVYIISFIVVYARYIIPIAAILGFVSWRISKAVRAVKDAPMLAREREKEIRRADPNFSIANFYSGVQNKISSVIFADTEEQIQSFAQGDLTPLLGKYTDVVGMDVDRMEIKRYFSDSLLQHADVDAVLLLTRYTGKRCVTRREYIRLKLVKSSECKTQVVCAPAVLKCRGCGTSLDLLQGKRCPYCGRELEMIQYDWIIQDMQRGIAAARKIR